MPGAQEGIGQDARSGRHHQRVFGAFGGQDAPVSSHPRGIRLPELEHQDRGELVGLSQQAGGAKLRVAVQFPSCELAGCQQLR
jgi:hypothetical protein